MGLGAGLIDVGVDEGEAEFAVGDLPQARRKRRSWMDRRGDAGLETRDALGFAWHEGVDGVAHDDPRVADGVENRARLAVLRGILPVDVLGVVVAGEAVDERLILGDRLGCLDVGGPIGHFDDVLRRFGAAPAAVVDEAVPRFVGEQQISLGIAGVADVLGEQPPALAAVVEAFELDLRLQAVGHLHDGPVEAYVEAPVQRARIVVSVVDGPGHLGIDDEHRAEHGKNLELRIALVVFVEVLQAVLAVDSSAAAECEQLEVAEGVVADERAEGLADHVGVDGHGIAFLCC